MVDFWKYERQNGPLKTVIKKLILIEALAKDGFDHYEMKGEKFIGYYLERKD